jgi:hypothetical protein
MLTTSPARTSDSAVNTLTLFCVSLVLLATLAVADARAQVVVHGTDAPRAAKSAKHGVIVETIKSRVRSGALPPSRLHTFIEADERATRRLSRLTEAMMKPEKSGFAGRTTIGLVRALPVAVRHINEMTEFRVGADTVRVLKVQAEGAMGLRLRFENVALPEGARIFVYSATNQDDVHIFQSNETQGEFWTPPVKGDAVIVEYVAPETAIQTAAMETALPFVIKQVSHIYKDTWAEDFGKRAAPCHRDIPEEWKAAARSVGLMQFVSGPYEAVCTGTLLNARNNDLTPYFLTAHHCVNTAAEAQSVSVRWFFDNPGAIYSGTAGASLLSTGAATDYTLLMLHGRLPQNLRWAGWTDIKPEISTPVTGIHHPAGRLQAHTFRQSHQRRLPAGLPARFCSNVHTMRFSSGMGEPGTSGSGLWMGTPADPLLIGQNFGGNATCSNPQGVAWYGRFDLTYPNIASFLEGGSDDEYEDNDTRQSARLVPDGFNAMNLIVKSLDEDWYRITVPVGGSLRVGIHTSGGSGDVDVQLFRGSNPNPVKTSEDNGGRENVHDYNDTGVPLEYLARVYVTDNVRADYSLEVSTQACSATIASGTDNVVAEAAGGSLHVSVSMREGCRWTSTSNLSWVTFGQIFSGPGLPSPHPPGTGQGTSGLLLVVAPNESQQPRRARSSSPTGQ